MSIEQLILDEILDDNAEKLAELISEYEIPVDLLFELKEYYLPNFLLGKPPIISIAAYFRARECVDYLISLGANLKIRDELKHRTPIHFAAAGGSIDILRVLETAGIQFADSDGEGNLPIHYACMFGHTDMVGMCIAKRMSPGATNNKGVKPILLAALSGSNDIINLLESNGANILETDGGGLNALHYAASGGYPDTVKLLIEKHLNINRTGHNSDPPILLAAANGSLSCVKALVEAGATYKNNRKRHSPLIEAAKFGHGDIVDYLLEKGCNINTVTSQGDTALSAAVANGHNALVRYLIDKKSTVTPQTLLNIKQDPELLRLLAPHVDKDVSLADSMIKPLERGEVNWDYVSTMFELGFIPSPKVADRVLRRMKHQKRRVSPQAADMIDSYYSGYI